MAHVAPRRHSPRQLPIWQGMPVRFPAKGNNLVVSVPPAPNAGARVPPARQEGPGGVGAALDGSRHVPCPRRECVRGRVAPLCPFQIIASGGMLLREAPDSPPARQKGTDLWAVRAL